MTPKEKAKELYNKYSVYNVNGKSIMKIGPEVKVFTLIAVDEIINNNSKIPGDLDGLHIMENILFWEEVKHEIKNL
jgi:hypothetical protein